MDIRFMDEYYFLKYQDLIKKPWEDEEWFKLSVKNIKVYEGKLKLLLDEDQIILYQNIIQEYKHIAEMQTGLMYLQGANDREKMLNTVSISSDDILKEYF